MPDKPIKLYVLLNDPTCINCVNMTHSYNHLDYKIEIIDVGPMFNRPNWLKGVPTLISEQKQPFLGPECVMWIRYYSIYKLK